MRYKDEIITLREHNVRVKQVNKTAARKLYDEGKTIYMHPCNLRVNNMWQSPCRIVPKVYDNTFDKAVNDFQWYNCDSERGRYANFFVEV